MKNSAIAIISIGASLILTIISGLTPSTPPGLVGAEWYGYPFTWLYRLVIAPQYNPWRVSSLGFVMDLIAYAVAIAILLFIVRALRK